MTPPPAPGSPPGGGARPRQQSRSELSGILTPDQPEREAVRHSAVDGAPQQLPAHRKGTLTGLGAVGLGMPPLPAEVAPTLPAPNPLQRSTVRRPTPPSSVALARRSDPPVGSASPPPADAATGQLGASLPPPSGDPEVAVREALRRRAEAAEARAAELERQSRVREESLQPGPYQPPVVVVDERPTKAPDSSGGDGSAKALRSALTKLVLGLAALLALLGIPLTAYIQALTTQIERSNAKASQANARADAVEAKAGTNAAERSDLEKRFRQHRANNREVWRLLGVEVPKTEGDPDPIDLEPVTPLCPAGKVCSGPQLILRKAP